MNRLATILFYLNIFVAVAHGQKNYAEAMQQGDTAFSNGEFKKAINKYFAAEAFDPSKKSLVKEKVNRVFYNLEILRQEAEAAKMQALTEKERAEKAEQAQASQTKIVLDEKNKLQTLNDFMKYNNKQLFEEIKRNKSDLLDLKIREYNLLNKYNDSLNDEAYRFYSMFTISEYYERNKNLDYAFMWADALCGQYPDSALSFMRRGIVNYYQHNWKKALSDMDTALAVNHEPYNVPVLEWNRALILSNLGRHKECRKSLSRALDLLHKMPEEQIWSDDFVSADIIKATSIYSIFMGRAYQVKTLEIYAVVNNLYAGILPVTSLQHINKRPLPMSVLLSIINYTSIHLKALPNEYIGYLLKGYCWELANYPEQAKANYRNFLRQNARQRNLQYNRYKNTFSSPLYNSERK